MQYQSRVPVERDRRQRYRLPNALAPEWSNEMAYIVGLTATDGCLFTGLRKINFKSGDRELVETYLRVLGRANPVKTKRTRIGRWVHFTEFGDARLYRWLLTIGLMPAKSLVLGAIDAPDDVLAPLFRGLLEGDGSILNFVHHPTVKAAPDYEHERLSVVFNSASRAHIEWIRSRAGSLFSVTGSIYQRRPVEGRHDFFRLAYGKHDSITLLSAMYPSSDVPKLERKWRIWQDYARRHGLN